MQLPTETGNKKFVIAERFPDNGMPENLMNLYVSDLEHFKILSLYSSLSRQLLGYKVFTQADDIEDEWLNSSSFNSVEHLNLDPDFELIPKAFSSDSAGSPESEILVSLNNKKEGIHIAYALDKWASSINITNSVVLLNQSDLISIFVIGDRKILFANTFKYSDFTEILYFIINAIQLSEISQENTTLYLDFEMMRNLSFVEFVSPYFMDVAPLKVPFENPDPEIEILPELLFTNHIMALCV